MIVPDGAASRLKFPVAELEVVSQRNPVEFLILKNGRPELANGRIKGDF